MNWLRKLETRFRALFAKRQLDAEMDDEMRSHIGMQTQENIANGMPPEEARCMALWKHNPSAGAHWPGGSAGQSNSLSFSRTDRVTSSGKTPIAPLITDSCSVVSLSTRIKEGRLRPVFRHSGWVGSTATVRAEDGAPVAEVINATRKSSGKSHCANTRQGRRFALVRSVNGNAAWTISPGWNMRRLLLEPGIFAAPQNVAIGVDLRLLFEKIEGPARLAEAGNFGARRFIRIEHEHSQPGVRRQRNAGRQFQDTVLFHHFDGLHARTLDHRRPIAKAQPAPMHKPR